MTKREGILNGKPPFRSGISGDDYGPIWGVFDSEDSTIAKVDGGEEMAEFFAERLNELAALGDSCRFCGCCTANEDDSPGCIGTTVAAAHDGSEHMYVSRYMLRVRDERVGEEGR